MKGSSCGASTKTNSVMFLSFLDSDAVLPLKLEAFCRKPCKHKIRSFLDVPLAVESCSAQCQPAYNGLSYEG